MKALQAIFRFSFLLFLILFTSVHLKAQEEKFKYGKVSMEDLKMTRYDKDTSAEAVILGDVGSSYFDYDKDKGFMLIFERLLRIKILTKDGYPWATHNILVYRDQDIEESVTGLKACTFNLVDKKVVETKMDNSAVFDEKMDPNWTNKKFTLPAVKEGSVIDIHYFIQSPFFGNLQSWNFQAVIPERYSEYVVSIPEFYHYKKIVSGFCPFTINDLSTNQITKTFQEFDSPSGVITQIAKTSSTYDLNYQEKIYKLAIKDVPAMRSEKFTSSMKNYHTRVEFELNSYQFPHSSFHDLTSSWEQIVHKILLYDDFGSQLKKTGLEKDVANLIKEESTVPEERMVLAYDYIRTNMKWNKLKSMWPTDGTIRKAVSEKKGNSADINIALILLLKEIGLNADPVVLSTRDHGIIRESSPNQDRLNYVIACADINGKKHLLDATDISRPYTMLPFRCLNGKGILAINDSIQWLDLLNAEKDNTRYFGEFKLTPEGELNGKLNVSYDGYSAFQNRDELKSKGMEQYTKDLKDGIKNAKVDSIKIVDKELTAPFNLSYNLQSQELVQNAGNMIYFNALLGMGEPTNPLTLEKREYPVDFGCPNKSSYIFVVDIPDGYAVESIPEKVAFALPNNGGTFKYTITQAGNKLAVNCIFNLTKTFFLTTEYSDLREFFTRMVAKEAEKVVLKKL